MIPPYSIHVECDEPGAGGANSSLVWRAAIAALQHQSAPIPSELTLLLTSDEVLQDLHRRFLGQDFPTDVLSFPAQTSSELTPAPDAGAGGMQNAELGNPHSAFPIPHSVLYLGDIAISLPRAEDQAREAGHSLEAELALLTVHGVLHLLGHDHATAKDRARMWRLQNKIVEAVFRKS